MSSIVKLKDVSCEIEDTHIPYIDLCKAHHIVTTGTKQCVAAITLPFIVDSRVIISHVQPQRMYTPVRDAVGK